MFNKETNSIRGAPIRECRPDTRGSTVCTSVREYMNASMCEYDISEECLCSVNVYEVRNVQLCNRKVTALYSNF